MAQTERATYRLITPELPLRFSFLGDAWRIEIAEIGQSGGWWRCMLEGPQHWLVAEGRDAATLTRALLHDGFKINARTFPGTVLHHLAHLGLAERIHRP